MRYTPKHVDATSTLDYRVYRRSDVATVVPKKNLGSSSLMSDEHKIHKH